MKNVFTILILSMFSFIACHRRPLDDGCINVSKIPVGTVWKKSEVFPQNVTALFFNESDGALVLEHQFENIDREIQTYVDIPYGEYTVLIFNEIKGQIKGISVEGADNYKNIAFSSVTDPNVKMRNDDRNFILHPDPVALALIHNFKVIPGIESKQLIGVEPEQIISYLNISVRVKGLKNALMPALADIHNLSSGYQVSRLNNNDKTASMQFIMNKENDEQISASFPLFGTISDRNSIVGYKSKALTLVLRFMLKDKNKTIIQRSVDITRLLEFKKINNGSVSLNLNVDLDESIPDVEPDKTGSSGFGSQLVDWEFINVPVQL